jgi:hypothetical protein
MEKDDFRSLSLLFHDVVMNDANVADKVKGLRKDFCELQYCFRGDEYTELIEKLHEFL